MTASPRESEEDFRKITAADQLPWRTAGGSCEKRLLNTAGAVQFRR